MTDKRDFTTLLDLVVQQLTSSITGNLEKRAATVFALIGLAGELGIGYGLLPWKPGYVIKAAITCFERWQVLLGPGQTEDSQILQSIADFVAKHGDSRFSQLRDHEDKPICNRAG